MLGDQARGRVAVLCRRREAVFRRMPVTDADKDHPGTPAHVTAERIVGFLVTQHPAAAMEIDHDRMWPRRRWPIETVGQRTVGAGERAVDNLADRSAGGAGGIEFIQACARTPGPQPFPRCPPPFPPHLHYPSPLHFPP